MPRACCCYRCMLVLTLPARAVIARACGADEVLEVLHELRPHGLRHRGRGPAHTSNSTAHGGGRQANMCACELCVRARKHAHTRVRGRGESTCTLLQGPSCSKREIAAPQRQRKAEARIQPPHHTHRRRLRPLRVQEHAPLSPRPPLSRACAPLAPLAPRAPVPAQLPTHLRAAASCASRCRKSRLSCSSVRVSLRSRAACTWRR